LSTTATPTSDPAGTRLAWTMLLALTAGFALSQAFRTVAAILAPPLQRDFGLSARELGMYAGAFHFSFGLLQLAMGLAIDVAGPRRTILWVSPLAVAGALVAATAGSYAQLLAGQVVIGIGCAPAFLVCTVFIARRFPPARFAAVSGATLGIGSVGLLLTGTPLAWVVEAWGWRAGYAALAAGAALAWGAVWLLVRDAPGDRPAQAQGLWQALRGYGELFAFRHTAGILLLASVTYAAFLALRGLWLGPLLVERHGLSLVASGHVALVLSLVGMAGPALFGRLDPGEARRRGWIVGWTLVVAAMYAVMAATRSAWVDIGVATAMSLAGGYIVLQYADVRSAYPPAMTGRAMAVFTMAMFLGVAVMQWLTGQVADAAPALGMERYAAVLGAVAVLLVLAALAFRCLPAPQRQEP
jgi:predicted MFS family arabinose efflux permease